MLIVDRLVPPESAPRLVRIAATLYLAHILCEGWIASSEIFLGLSLLFAGAALYRKELKVSVHVLLFPLALFLVGSSISAALSVRPLSAFLQIGEWFSLMTFPLGLSLYRSIPGLERRAVTAFSILGVFLGSYGLFQYFVLGYGRLGLEQRITGPAAHVMTYSGIVMPVTLMMVVFWIDRKRLLYLAPALLGSIALVLTFTRGVWIGWIAGFATLLLLRKPRWILFAIPMLILGIALSPLPVFGRFISMFDLKQSSNLDRIRMVQAGAEIIRDHPLWGVGPANIKEIYPLYRLPDAPRFRIPHLHNNLVQLWAERGLLAVSAYLLLILMFVRDCGKVSRSERRRRAFADAGIAVAISLFCAGFFEFNFGDTEVLLTMLDLFALLLAAMAGAKDADPSLRDPLEPRPPALNGTPEAVVA